MLIVFIVCSVTNTMPFNGNGLFLAGDGATFCHAVPDCLQRTSYIVSRSQAAFAKRERLFGRLPGDEGSY